MGEQWGSGCDPGGMHADTRVDLHGVICVDWEWVGSVGNAGAVCSGGGVGMRGKRETKIWLSSTLLRFVQVLPVGLASYQVFSSATKRCQTLFCHLLPPESSAFTARTTATTTLPTCDSNQSLGAIIIANRFAEGFCFGRNLWVDLQSQFECHSAGCFLDDCLTRILSHVVWPRSVANTSAAGTTIGPATGSDPTNSTILFDVNLGCSLSSGTVLLEVARESGDLASL